MKKCPRCKEEKELTEFTKDGHRCLICQRELAKEHYQKNKGKYKASKKKNRIKVTSWLNEYKQTLCCKNCGEKDTICLDFHHKDKTIKIDCISRLVRNLGLPKLKQELDKCEVLCSNCHRKLHRDELINETHYLGREARTPRMSLSPPLGS